MKLTNIVNFGSNIKFSAFILGLSSIISQVVVLREVITIFYGNETAYAIILASWLFWISVGSFIVSCVVNSIKKPKAFIAISQFLISFILPLTIIFIRVIKPLLNIKTGEIIGILPICIISYLILAPLTVLFGALFTLICRLSDISERSEKSTKQISVIYMWESIGSAVGGLVFSFILINLLTSFQIVYLICMFNFLTIVYLYRYNIKKWFFWAGISLLIVFFILTFNKIDRVDNYIRKLQWKGLKIVKITDSIYGNIALTKIGSEYNLYENGLLSFSTKDDLSSEERIHFPLLSHPNPKKILLVGNGAGGALKEILKYKGVIVDYLELDPEIINISKKYLPEKHTNVFKDQRINIVHVDARYFIKNSQSKYSVIIINLSDPYTALINRYYTKEFFKEAYRILYSDGIISLYVSSSENYLSEENRSFLRSINTTLKSVFADVKSIPGDTNIFLACKSEGVLAQNSDNFIKSLKERNIATKYIREYYLPFRLSRDRVSYIEDILKKEGMINSDIKPITYLYDIILWSTHFNSKFKLIIEEVRKVKTYYLLLFPLIILLVGTFLSRKFITLPISVSITTTGFSEIIFQIIVILAFQTLYGFAYYKIGLIISTFMIGLVFGSYYAGELITRKNINILKTYKIIQLLICLYPLLLPVLFIVFRDVTIIQKFPKIFASVFASLPLIAGFIGGVQYPLATHIIYSKNKTENKKASTFAGFLYASDVLGATIGAVITGTILIPIYGINVVSLFCVFINASVLILLLRIKEIKI